MPDLIIAKRFEFAIGHYPKRSDWSDQKNRTVYGPDESFPNGHGHNVRFYSWMTGDIQSDTGMIQELSIIKNRLLSNVLNEYDHFYLNDRPKFKGVVPTPERLAHQLLLDTQAEYKALDVSAFSSVLQDDLGSWTYVRPDHRCFRQKRLVLPLLWPVIYYDTSKRKNK